MAEENPGKSQQRDCLMKSCAFNHRLKWGPFPPNDVGGITLYIREEEGKNSMGIESGFINAN
jgi:hypothetical protein